MEQQLLPLFILILGGNLLTLGHAQDCSQLLPHHSYRDVTSHHGERTRRFLTGSTDHYWLAEQMKAILPIGNKGAEISRSCRFDLTQTLGHADFHLLRALHNHHYTFCAGCDETHQHCNHLIVCSRAAVCMNASNAHHSSSSFTHTWHGCCEPGHTDCADFYHDRFNYYYRSSHQTVHGHTAYQGKTCNGILCNTGSHTNQQVSAVVNELSKVNGGWGQWGAWTSCSVTCGSGTKSRHRKCDHPAPANGGDHCHGNADESYACTWSACSVDGGWGQWTTWSICSVTCGSGTILRHRKCDHPAPAHGGDFCYGQNVETHYCSQTACKVNGGWGGWTAWSICSATCDTGTSFRSRNCDSPKPSGGGAVCGTQSFDSKPCQAAKCAVDGGWGQWSDWSACPVSCGSGVKFRGRKCDSPPASDGGADCGTNSTSFTKCDAGACPVDGGWSGWGNWSSCSVTCGLGTVTRLRTCSNPAPSGGGADCPDKPDEANPCYATPCPVDGGWSGWGNWSSCSVTCGLGTVTRLRTCSNPAPSGGGADCPDKPDEDKPCRDATCAVDGAWSHWSNWTDCSTTCGAGVVSRSRTCNNPAPSGGGQDCGGAPEERNACYLTVCPVNGGWSGWGSWSSCSVTCGSGNSTRTRTCDNPPPSAGGAQCPATSVEAQSCVLGACPVDGGWSQWGQWIGCSKTCGGGSTYRTRACDSPSPSLGGAQCNGSSVDSKDCSVQACPVVAGAAWTEWGQYGPCQGNGNLCLAVRSRNCSTGVVTDCPVGHVSTVRTCSQSDCLIATTTLPTTTSTIITNPSTATSTAKTNPSTATSTIMANKSTVTSTAKTNPSIVTSTAKTNPSTVTSTAKTNPSTATSTAKTNPSTATSTVKSILVASTSTANTDPSTATSTVKTSPYVTTSSVKANPSTATSTANVNPAVSTSTVNTATSGATVTTATTKQPTSSNTGSKDTVPTTTVGSTTTTKLASSPTVKVNNISSTATPTKPGFTAAQTSSGNVSVTQAPTSTGTTTTAPVNCYVCDGPPDVCELAYVEKTCAYPDNYCINELENFADGGRSLIRRCGNQLECYNEWYLSYSDDDKCTGYDEGQAYTRKLKCTFCCQGNGCNERIVPPVNTLYHI